MSPTIRSDEGLLCSAAMTDLIDMSATGALDRLAAWQIALRGRTRARAP